MFASLPCGLEARASVLPPWFRACGGEPGRKGAGLTAPAARAAITGMEAVFDTLAYTRRLKAAGFSEEQAEAQAEALRAAFHEGVATKADLAKVEARIANLEVRLLLAVVAVGGFVIAAVKLL